MYYCTLWQFFKQTFLITPYIICYKLHCLGFSAKQVFPNVRGFMRNLWRVTTSWGTCDVLLHHSGTTTSRSHILFSPFSWNSGRTEFGVYHSDFEHQQLHLDRLCHWQRQLPVRRGWSSASNAGTSAPNARWVTAKPILLLFNLLVMEEDFQGKFMSCFVVLHFTFLHITPMRGENNMFVCFQWREMQV